MNKNSLWILAAILSYSFAMTACGGCSAIDNETNGDEVIEADSLVVGDKLP